MSASWNRTLAGAALAMLLAIPASAQVLFKWTDASGKVNYSDRPPKNFTGVVERIEPDVQPSPPLQPPAPPRPPVTSDAKQPAPPPDALATRRATRTQLETRLARARADVDAARKALTDAEIPNDDERQVVQQRAAKGGMHGMSPRSNCREERKDGMKWHMCPTFVPTPEYHERFAQLEAKLKDAEEELSAAEQAYRRGVD